MLICTVCHAPATRLCACVGGFNFNHNHNLELRCATCDYDHPPAETFNHYSVLTIYQIDDNLNVHKYTLRLMTILTYINVENVQVLSKL